MALMRTETPQPIRLSDYRPPAFLVDEVHLTFDLSANATRVKARLQVRRNGDGPLVFNQPAGAIGSSGSRAPAPRPLCEAAGRASGNRSE